MHNIEINISYPLAEKPVTLFLFTLFRLLYRNMGHSLFLLILNGFYKRLQEVTTAESLDTALASLYSKSCLCRKNPLVFPTDWIGAAVTLHTLNGKIFGLISGYHGFFLVYSQYRLTVPVPVAARPKA